MGRVRNDTNETSCKQDFSGVLQTSMLLVQVWILGRHRISKEQKFRFELELETEYADILSRRNFPSSFLEKHLVLTKTDLHFLGGLR